MHYIVFDLEFNQDFSSMVSVEHKILPYPYEIIQIGAIKIDSDFNTKASFNRYVKPTIYSQISNFVSELTGITTEQLADKKPFPDVYHDFLQFVGEDSNIFCIWGRSDIKELYRNADYHHLDKTQLPLMYINLQPYVSSHFELPSTKLLKLEAAVDALHIGKPYPFHNAYYDAYYTVKVWKQINTPSIQSVRYNPDYVKIKPRQPKKIIDFDKLMQQFEKMYDRKLSTEEQSMIKLAYQMGKTNQFLK